MVPQQSVSIFSSPTHKKERKKQAVACKGVKKEITVKNIVRDCDSFQTS